MANEGVVAFSPDDGGVDIGQTNPGGKTALNVATRRRIRMPLSHEEVNNVSLATE